MAMQTSMGLSKILILIGAGYGGTIVLKNNSLSDVLGELQNLVKGIEKSEDGSDSDAIANQVRRLAMEVRQMASSRQITVLNGGSSNQLGNVTSLVVPAAVLGAVGYGYMWWKGFSFSDLLYVTKSNMANAVSSMTKHLEQVSSALAATKRHLTQRIENLDGKLDDQKEMSKLIKNEVTEVRADLSQIGFDLDSLHKMVSGLDGKICSLEDKQDYANAGVWYLCNFVGGKDEKMTEFLKALPKPTKQRAFLGFGESQNKTGLKQFAATIASGSIDSAATIASGSIDSAAIGGTMQNDIDISPRTLSRVASISIKC